MPVCACARGKLCPPQYGCLSYAYAAVPLLFTYVTVCTEPSGAPDITYTETTTHSVLLRWSPLPLSQQNGIISGYVINYLEDGQEQTVSVPSYVFEYTFEAVPFTEYVLSVAAVNSEGVGPFSITVEVRTPEDSENHY